MGLDLKEPLEFLVTSVCKEPDIVKIGEKIDGAKMVYEIFATDSDVGQIIGKSGRTIKSIDLILRSLKKGKGEFELKVVR